MHRLFINYALARAKYNAVFRKMWTTLFLKNIFIGILFIYFSSAHDFIYFYFICGDQARKNPQRCGFF